MKHTIFIITLFFVTFCVPGQTSKFQIGAEGGASVAFIYWWNYLNIKNSAKPGYTAGVFLQWDVNSLLALKTSLSFERKGAASSYDVNTLYEHYSVKTRFDMDYLVLPVLARLSFGKNVRFFLNAGPFIGYLLKSVMVQKNTGPYPGFTVNNTKGNKRLDFGVAFGIGVQVPINQNISLSLEARDNLGLIKLSSNAMTNSANLLLGVSYKF